MGYNTKSWKQTIDPAFDKIINRYLEGLHLMHLFDSDNEGFLFLDFTKKELERIKLEGYPSIAPFYENDKIESIVSDLGIIFDWKITEKDFKRIKSKYSKNLEMMMCNLMDVAATLGEESKAYYLKSFEPFVTRENLMRYRMTAGKLREVVEPYADEYCGRMKRIFLMCGVVYLFYPLAIGIFKYRAVRQRKRKYERGASLITAREVRKQIGKDKEKTDLPFGEVRLPVSAEPKHAFIVGRPGVGKTVFLSQVLERLKERGERGIVYDFKGDYVSRFYNPDTDILFNPLDSRCVGWSIFNEITTAMDIDAIAHCP